MKNSSNRRKAIAHLHDNTMRIVLACCCCLMVTLVAMGKGTDKVKFPGGRCYMFRLTLADKNGTPFTLDHPEEFLSERALDRRRRQQIAVDSTDLPISPVYEQLVAAEGVEIISKSKWNNTLLVRSRRLETMKSLSRLDFVADAAKVWTSPDSIEKRKVRARYISEVTRMDTIAPNIEGVAFEQIDMLNGTLLHNRGFRGRGMHIAVLDGGFMNADVIPALAKIRLLGSADFVYPRSENIFKETDHGTMVLSTMATDEPDLFIGTAPEASYWLLRTEESQTETPAEEDFWAAAVEFADSAGVDVISSSLGYHDFNEPTMNYRYRQLDGRSTLISRTASMLADKGIILVNSAGNDGMGTWKKINVPADAHNILTIGAVSANKQNAAFSAIGPTADGRIKPDLMALGSPTSVITGRGVISKDIGTSFATPVVAGLVACLWQAFPQLSAKQIIEQVRQCGDNADYPDNIFGYGIPDFSKAYQSCKDLHQ